MVESGFEQRGGRVITDAELRALSVEQRRVLARKLAALAETDATADRTSDLARRRRAVLLVAVLSGVALVLWTLRLGADLPARYLVGHWDLAWVGFDLLLAGSIAATGMLTWRGSPARAGASFATAVLLICDAWFDVSTAAGSTDLVTSVLSAVLVELPLAALAGVLAYRQLRSLVAPALGAHARV